MNCLTKRIFVFLLYCIIHGSAVLGENKIRRCITDVHRVFDKERYTNIHFLHAFQNLNFRYFNGVNHNASSYFENFLKIIRNTSYYNSISPPNRFCGGLTADKLLCYEALYLLFANTNFSRNFELSRILTVMSGYEAFHYVYRNIIYPQHEVEPTLEKCEGNVALYQWTHKLWIKEDTKKRKIFRYMVDYLQVLRNLANEISQHVDFGTVEDYCKFNALGRQKRKTRN